MRKADPASNSVTEIHGDVIALECFVTALCQALSPTSRTVLRNEHQRTTEVARTLLLNSGVPDGVIDAFERTVQRQADALNQVQGPAASKALPLGDKAIRSNEPK